jgi:hypothetical protein
MKSPPAFSFQEHRVSTQIALDSPSSPLVTPNRLFSPGATSSRLRSPGIGLTSPNGSLVPLGFVSPQVSASIAGLLPNRGQSLTPISPLFPSPPPPQIPVLAPIPRRSRTPPPNVAALRGSMGTSSSRTSTRSVARASNGSPAPPPRSTNRPGSGISHRPPPVAVPRRDERYEDREDI